MEDNLERLNGLQEKIASGKQFQTMSDDPGKAASAISLRSSLQINQNYIENDYVVNDWLSANDFGLQRMSDLGSRAQNLTLQGINDTNSQAERNAIATEIDQMLVQAVDIANSKHNGKYIFAGFKTKSAVSPFVIDAAHTAVTVNPPDDTHSIQVDVSPGQTITTNFIGSAIFDSFFKAMINVRDALRANDATLIGAAKTGLDTSLDPITTALTTNGARQRQLGLTIDTMEKAKIELKSLLSSKEDVNMAEAISQLSNQQSTYQAVLQVSQRAISTMSLFDVLQ
jgi:flagellar hook-associated protein 3 FlgL